jgi:peptidoglycan/LPS O-acetylase OafA/YrhL
MSSNSPIEVCPSQLDRCRRRRNVNVRPVLPRRLPGIDILRAYAALMVLASHTVNAMTLWQPGFRDSVSPRALEYIGDAVISAGVWGVGMFFVLSGMCIHLQSARSGTISPAWARYFKRRFTRIYPPHLVVLVASALIGLCIPARMFGDNFLIAAPTGKQLAAHLGMVHSFWSSTIFSINAVLWTIALETHFYVLYPVVLWLRRRYRLDTICLTLFIVSVMARLATKSWLDENIRHSLQMSVVCRWWEWVLGCIVAERLVGAKTMQWSRRDIALALLALTLVGGTVLSAMPLGLTIRPLVWPWMFAVAIWYAARQQTSPTSLFDRVIGELGRESYSIYLTHPIAITLCAWVMHVDGPSLPGIVACTLASLALAHLYYRAVERPFLVRAARMGDVPS